MTKKEMQERIDALKKENDALKVLEQRLIMSLFERDCMIDHAYHAMCSLISIISDMGSLEASELAEDDVKLRNYMAELIGDELAVVSGREMSLLPPVWTKWRNAWKK